MNKQRALPRSGAASMLRFVILIPVLENTDEPLKQVP
jgi:hypothetical protein